MDHSYSSEREKLQKVDHSYFLTAKKTPTVVLRRAQVIKEIKEKERMPVDQDHSYHRLISHTPLVSAAGGSKKVKSFDRNDKHNYAIVNVQTTKRGGLKQAQGSLKNAKVVKDLLHQRNEGSPEKTCSDDMTDHDAAEINSKIHFEHSYFSKSCDIPEDDCQRCSSTTLFHDHAYISHKPYLLTSCVAELSL